MKRYLLAMFAVLALATVGGDISAAPVLHGACVFDGWSNSSGTYVPFAGVSQATSTLTGAATGKYLAGTDSFNVAGSFNCGYTLVVGTSSVFSFNNLGVGTDSSSWTPLATNPASCGPAFVSHGIFLITPTGSVGYSTDTNGSVSHSTCLNQTL